MKARWWIAGGVLGVLVLRAATRRPPAPADIEVEALGRLLASETSKREAWPYIAVATRNAAAARKITIAQLLRQVGGKDVGWGKNEDGHWAGTSKPPTAESLSFARRFLAGEVPDPPGSEGIRSFFEVDEHGKRHDSAPFLKRHPELRLATTVAGWEFYRRAA